MGLAHDFRDQLAEMLRREIDDALNPSSLAIYFRAGNGEFVTASQVPEKVRKLPGDLQVLKHMREHGQSWEIVPSIGEAPALAILESLQPECLVPMLAVDGQLLGLAVLGPRLSGESYSGEDRRLLDSVANQAALTLQNIALAEYIAEGLVNERTRIARELHDTLLQSFQGLLLRFQAASNLLPTRPEEAKEKLDSAIVQASQAITEGRDAVQGLRASAVLTNDLAVAIRALGEELAAGETNQKAPVLEVAVEGAPLNLHPIVRDEVYKIAAEAVRNAFRHAQANRVEVEIQYNAHQFLLRVRDDGKGIDAQLLADEGRAGHWGLHGMRERAKLMGGNVEIWSHIQCGTQVELTLPNSTAYDTRRSRRYSWFSKREA